MKKIWSTLVLIALINMALLTAKTYALTINQENDAWELLASPKAFYTTEITPWGLYAGEFNSNWSSFPYNGVFFSRDLGQTWQESGLFDRGVTDIAFDDDGNLYATVYYWGVSEAPGLYKSSDKGSTWVHIGPDCSTASVATCGNNIILGTYSHGLWVSDDGGQTWNQNKDIFGSSGDYLRVNVADDAVVVSNYYNSYISYDCGNTWGLFTAVPGYLLGLAVNNNVWLACSDTTAGLYRSTDNGETFYPIPNWSPNPCYATTYYNGVFYASSHSNNTGYYNVLKSRDKGVTWEDENPSDELVNYIRELAYLVAEPGYIFATSPGTGLFRYKVPPYVPKTQSFLDKLWARDAMSDQTDTITSYFDHAYPLLAYPYKSEPTKEANTTVNFWGDKEKTPQLYYSSHDGVDFGLKYGTPILAPASGYASYSYSAGGGHTIKIDHQNGYQTQYLHFQKEGLFVTSKDKEPKWIDKNQQVGLVGLTGNTTGPHLHFGVRYDKNLNGDFTDDVPDGRIDPYSWQDERSEDPWEVYSWTDDLGDHTGAESYYLWKEFLEVNSQYLDDGGGTVSADKVSITIPAEALDKNITLKAQKSTKANVELADVVNSYIQGTVTKFTAYDNLGDAVTSFANLIDISFDLSQLNLSAIIPSSLKILYFNAENQFWEEIASVWDESTKKITGFTNHLSEFAVFGDKIDPDPPSTIISISGNQTDGWYTQSPFIELSATDGEGGSGVAKTFFSLDGGDSWEEYLTQTQIVKEGIFAVLYRSVDLAENWEPTQDSHLLKVDTLGLFKDEIKLEGSVFTIANTF